jgi:stage IV sporulation protein FB
MEGKSNFELKAYIQNRSGEYNDEVISAAQNELNKRMLQKQVQEQETEQERKTFRNSHAYPEKPISEEVKPSIQKSVLSLALFIAAFYLIFKWELYYILILTGVIFIHELGHFFAMKIYKFKDLNIFFIPLLGAATTGEKEDISQKQKTIIAFAGPLPGIIIGTVFSFFGYRYNNEILRRTGDIFVTINVFNLLPIYPLDGGRIIKNLFFQSNEKINIAFLWISIIVLIAIAFNIEAYSLLLVPLILFAQMRQQTQIASARKMLNEKGFDTKKTYAELSDEEYWLIRNDLGSYLKSLSGIVDPNRYAKAPNENKVIGTINQILNKEPIKDIGILGKTGFLFIWILAFLVPIALVFILHTLDL